MKLTIQSRDDQTRVHLTDTPNGVSVDIYQQSRIDSRYLNDGMWKRVGHEVIDAPFHVVCDNLHRLIGGQ